MKIDLPNMKSVAKEGAELSKEAQESLELVKKLEIKSNSDYHFASKAVAEIKDKGSKADETRRFLVDPFSAVVKDVNAAFKPALDLFGKAEKVLKDSITGFALRRQKERDEKITVAGQAESPEEAEALIVEAEELEVPEIPGVSLRESWVGEVYDADEIPKGYMIPDLKALEALTKAKKCDPKIPGWSAWPERSATITVDKIRRAG